MEPSVAGRRARRSRTEGTYPLPETLTEAEQLAASIEQAVWRETAGGIRDLHVEVSEEGVLLSGHCRTYYAKQRAQHAAMRLPYPGRLTNDIQVI
ncbi:MAG TPA: BON domain-containing protein [Planctomycetaceae bacterium]|nr:BON domain-containing protein [Planctomycetaceae bacterium]HIQ21359.1 BON domain-containing protein [Planctomycetota bacterium]